MSLGIFRDKRVWYVAKVCLKGPYIVTVSCQILLFMSLAICLAGVYARAKRPRHGSRVGGAEDESCRETSIGGRRNRFTHLLSGHISDWKVHFQRDHVMFTLITKTMSIAEF